MSANISQLAGIPDSNIPGFLQDWFKLSLFVVFFYIQFEALNWGIKIRVCNKAAITVKIIPRKGKNIIFFFHVH